MQQTPGGQDRHGRGAAAEYGFAMVDVWRQGGGQDNSVRIRRDDRHLHRLGQGNVLVQVLLKLARGQGESPRVLRRLQLLREWSHEDIKQVFPRSS